MTTHRKNKILIVAYPNQGQINPSLCFAHRLVNLGVNVTFCTSFSVIKRIDMKTTHHGLTFAPFSDGHDHGHQPTTTLQQFISDFATNGASAVAEIITTAAVEGQPFDHLVYTTILSWAARVAIAHGIESTLLWCQPATILGIYYYYFTGYESLISSNNNNPEFPLNLPGLPLLTIADLPSFLSASCPMEHEFVREFMKDHIDVLKFAPRVLVNTFDELEAECVKAMEKIVMLPVGPLVPPEILDNSLKCDFFEKPMEDYIGWLNTKSKSSVVYVSFGSLSNLSTEQVEEIAFGLIESERPFLWVIRDGGQSSRLRNLEVLKKQGVIVGWCSQVEVLNHQAIGCFVTHCGWNSTLEALAAGVPTVGCSQWSDQPTNAKMIQDVWKTGVKVKRREGDGMVEGKEIKRCLEMVMEDEDIKKNALKWRDIARQAIVVNSGSSIINLLAFLDDA
ncbi:hypothetical protein QVD17_37655 [Tagetes erecta]|uniref:Glycosyltransferase n=1 Tax=Tagetes erecta TaxID=13708 RepID=A0AAD8JX36_TARER|nr:hypothetical protein QVD17_37655 [Tagetes erecta]